MPLYAEYRELNNYADYTDWLSLNHLQQVIDLVKYYRIARFYFIESVDSISRDGPDV